MDTSSSLLLFILFISPIPPSAGGSKVAYVAYNVVKYGAKHDGASDSTATFSLTWEEACKSTRPAAVHVPRGTYLLKPIVFYGPCKSKMMFHVEGKIVGPSHYWEFGKSGFWVLFYKLDKLTIHGGTYDAKGSDFWKCRKSQSKQSISIIQSKNVVIKNIRSLNSQMFHIAIDHCHHVLLKQIYIQAPSRSLNTDGIHIQSSEGITISDAIIRTGDDCVAIGPGSKNLRIDGVKCGPGHGISIGSLGVHEHEDGVENVVIKDSSFIRAQNGVRIKSWGGSGVKISGITYKNIHGSSASKVAVKFICSASRPCTDLKLRDVKLTYHKTTATSYCTHAVGGATGTISPKSCFGRK
ncbi:unnamed protein product [Linum perenne]